MIEHNKLQVHASVSFVVAIILGATGGFTGMVASFGFLAYAYKTLLIDSNKSNNISEDRLAALEAKTEAVAEEARVLVADVKKDLSGIKSIAAMRNSR
jgi:hypothetical protein